MDGAAGEDISEELCAAVVFGLWADEIDAPAFVVADVVGSAGDTVGALYGPFLSLADALAAADGLRALVPRSTPHVLPLWPAADLHL